VPVDGAGEQLDLFADGGTGEKLLLAQQKEARELRRQEAVLQIRQKYGKNAILKGMNYLEGATTRQRNAQVGGHRR
jgi:DNA polymerase V